jgi:N6-adenosine-specific RNA methylase IME4
VQVMAWHRINEYGQKKCIATGYTNDHSKQLILVVVNMTFSIHKELVYAPSHGKVNII